MPFDPLLTDEKLEKPAKAERDTDTIMLYGCSGFVLTSLLTYAFVVWPFFVFQGIHLTETLFKACAFALIPALIFGAVTIRRFGLATACGFVGGGMATSVFLFVRLTEVQVRRGNREMEQPDYPAIWTYIVPLAWVLAVVLVAVLFIRKSELEMGPTGSQQGGSGKPT